MDRRLLAALAAVATLLPTAPALAFDPAIEADNFSKTTERDRYVVLTPEFQERLNRQHVEDPQRSLAIRREELAAGADARLFETNVCFSRERECAGDVRFYEWEETGFGKTEEVLFGARDGATISAKVWATKSGPAERPGIVITTGSVQAPETLYWGYAATLAKHGYVVLTYDVQGQGQSDTFGEGDDRMEGVPSQAGQPFYDGTEDALDYLLSSPGSPYDPRPSCGNANEGVGSDHSPKHERRVALGLNSPHNPFWDLVDPDRIGIAGHSLGAGAVSYIGQLDPRVDAIVGWDNLRAPAAGGRFGAPECPSGSSPRPAELPITKPAIGFSNDYGLTVTPLTADPDPQGANGGFAAYKAAGVDSMQVNTRGGTHFEYGMLPGVTVPPLGLATLRGMDMSAWYTTAWFDRYVKCQGDGACASAAERRLLTDRWRDDARGGAVDPNGDPNVFSFYLRSRFDVSRTDGGRAVCDDMRAGCPAMKPDGLPAGYDHVADAHTAPPGDDPQPGGGGGGSGGGPACSLPQRGTSGDDNSETLPPSDAGDAIRGRGGDDRLRGGRGDDCLYGGGGDDRLKGGPGRDRLDCGGGKADRAVIDVADPKPKGCEKVRRIRR